MTNGVELSVCMHVWTLTVLLKLHASGSVCFRPHQPSRQLLKWSVNHSAGHAWNMHLVSRVLDMNNAKRVNLVTTSLRHSNFIVKFFSLILPEEERIIKIMSLPIRLSEKPVIFFFFFWELQNRSDGSKELAANQIQFPYSPHFFDEILQAAKREIVFLLPRNWS